METLLSFLFASFFTPPSNPNSYCRSLFLVPFVSPPKWEMFLDHENGETEIKGFLELSSFHA